MSPSPGSGGQLHARRVPLAPDYASVAMATTSKLYKMPNLIWK